MAGLVTLQCCLLFVVCSLICSCLSNTAEDKRQLYIVYMGSLPERVHSPYKLQQLHNKMLEEVVDARFLRKALVTSYKRSFNGFAAYLTNQEKQKLARYDGVVSIFPSRTLWPQTTRSWDYMGLTENVFENSPTGSNVVIGVFDSGIWPESESFIDRGFAPIPKKWKGVCQGGQNFTCNKKLIGARYYMIGEDTARDTVGHGTHTASTAAGNYVRNASFYGIAQGTARGGFPSARIAAYRVCSVFCSEAGILSAFDDAIADGVDIITISVGSMSAIDMQHDSIAIGSLHAMQKGALTAQAAGNYGFTRTVSSVAPWLLTVAASTTDRGIVTKITLGNGKTIVGKGVNSFRLNGTEFPLVYGNGATRNCSEMSAKICTSGCLDSSLVSGKIVLCDDVSGIDEAFRAGALGAIAKSGVTSDVSSISPLPASALVIKDMESVRDYVSSTKDAKAFISTSEAIKNNDAPLVASFSSKGPNPILPNTLKPDITAPGVEILAAFSPAGSVSSSPRDKRSVQFQILSGTSMSCPHVAGAAAYVKSAHPDWSPSAIKSALMTTAWPMDHAKGDEFSYGAGHLNPVNATNPGLVYETCQEDYVKMLCKFGYSSGTVRKLFNDKNIDCSKLKQAGVTRDDFNYPSMTKRMEKGAPRSGSFSRTVTNVGVANSTYTAKISSTPDLNVTVEPSTLSFRQLNEKVSFVVTVKAGEVKSTISASLEWSDGVHVVRSPIVVY